jgi:hypothetical protein
MNNKIRHTGCCIAMILCLIATSFVSSGCNKDGNETISLEFGNIRTMIIGRWYTSGGVYWDFYDSYYTRSDMGDRHLRWYIDDSYNGERPYYGYIYLDNSPYGIVSMGGDSWTVGDSQGGTIDFTRDGNGTATENSGSGGSSSSSGSSNLVKRIEKRLNNSIVVSVDFEYDSRQLVSKATYTGKFGEVWPCSPEGTTYYYTATSGALKITATRTGTSGEVATARLDSQNHITELNFYPDETKYFTHNSKGQCTQYRYGSGSPITYTWENDCIKKVSGASGRSNHSHSTTVNQANLNLNWMVDDQMFDEDQVGLALCGYVSAKEKYLYDLHWKLENGRPVSVIYGNYTYNIYYY